MRHRLGRPLPHQQADTPRADPRPPELCPAVHAHYRGHPVLATVSRCYPSVRGTLPTCYSPVRRFPQEGLPLPVSSLDLHVLGTPPAFVLSQDQTLRRDVSKLQRTPLNSKVQNRLPDHSLSTSSKSPLTRVHWSPIHLNPAIVETTVVEASRQAHCSVLKEQPDNKNAGCEEHPASAASWSLVSQGASKRLPSLFVPRPKGGVCQRSPALRAPMIVAGLASG